MYWWLKQQRNRRKRRSCWKRPCPSNLMVHSAYVCAAEMILHDSEFQNCYRMSPETFKLLVTYVGPAIQREDTNWRESVGVEERLLITLKHFATGLSFKSLTHEFHRGDTTIGKIVYECSTAIWQEVQPLYMPVPTEEVWKSIADRSYELWDLPHCIGNINGKHIRIAKPPHSGSEYFNYKSYFSIVLLACSDADGIFTTIDVGEPGRFSDGAVFRTSTLGRLLDQSQLNIPVPVPMPNDNTDFPFFFAADEAFPLKTNVMRPYPQRVLDNPKRIFNGRLSRSRQNVECSFGMFTAKFQLLARPMRCRVRSGIAIIKAICVLHNFIRMREGKFATPRLPKERHYTSDSVPCGNTIQPANAQAIRDHLKGYFLDNQNAVPWQDRFRV